MSNDNSALCGRRKILRYGGLAIAGGFAGCSGGGDTETPVTETSESTNGAESPTPTPSTATPTASAQSSCGPGETEIASAPDSADRITFTGNVTGINNERGNVYINDGTGVAAIKAGGTDLGERFSTGECLTVTGGTSMPTIMNRDAVKTRVFPDEIVRPGEEDTNLLEQSLPDPSQYIPSDLDAERAVGTVKIRTSGGSFFTLNGPGDGKVTAIAGYFDGAGLDPTRNWGGKVSKKSGLIHTHAVGGRDSFSFDLFDGLALRAVKGINLVVEGTTVAERVRLVRYRRDDGVFEQEPVVE